MLLESEGYLDLVSDNSNSFLFVIFCCEFKGIASI